MSNPTDQTICIDKQVLRDLIFEHCATSRDFRKAENEARAKRTFTYDEADVKVARDVERYHALTTSWQFAARRIAEATKMLDTYEEALTAYLPKPEESVGV